MQLVDVGTIISRYPQRELEIRRHCLGDPVFRSICSDYAEASTALARWRNAGDAGAPLAEDYARLLLELEAEILDRLGRKPPPA
jgi:hypothetical protein